MLTALNILLLSLECSAFSVDLFPDTEGSFMAERVLQIAEACAQDMLEYNNVLRRDSQACRVDEQHMSFLDNIFYFRICTYTEQIAVINYLEKFISEHKDVGTGNWMVVNHEVHSFIAFWVLFHRLRLSLLTASLSTSVKILRTWHSGLDY